MNAGNLAKAYTAGLMDGEGSISLSVRSAKRTKAGLPKQAPALLIQLTSTNEEVVDWLITTWKVGHKHQSYRPTRPNHKAAYAWHVYGAKAATVLEAIMPYLIIKRAQAELGIEARAMVGKAGHKIGEEEMLRRLKLRDRMIALNGDKGTLTFPTTFGS